MHSALAATRPWLPRELISALRTLDRCLWKINTRFEKRPPLDPGLHSKLKAEFGPEVERLSDLLERDLTSWSK